MGVNSKTMDSMEVNNKMALAVMEVKTTANIITLLIIFKIYQGAKIIFTNKSSNKYNVTRTMAQKTLTAALQLCRLNKLTHLSKRTQL